MQNKMITERIKESAKSIKLLVCDVDGVLTKGEVFLDNSNLELKAFNIKDGLGIKLLQKHGIEIAIITGRTSKIVERRMLELDVKHVFQGKMEKIETYENLLSSLNLSSHEVAYVGDDLPDLPLIRRAGLGIAVSDAHEFVKQKADWVTAQKGGCGAVRDIADLLLDARGVLDDLHQEYWQR